MVLKGWGAIAFLLALAACHDGVSKIGSAREMAYVCKARGGPSSQCDCFAFEIAKQVDAPLLARMTEHVRAKQGERGARLLNNADLRLSRTVQARARELCGVSQGGGAPNSVAPSPSSDDLSHITDPRRNGTCLGAGLTGDVGELIASGC